MAEYESVIGLEVHAQLDTATKIFCGCLTEFGADGNSQTCPICLGMPGVLPVLNKKAVELAIRSILAVGGQVQPKSIFARKNYFYPDLPKGYQISQYERPLGLGGSLTIHLDGTTKRIGITRIHLEEDAGKSFHPEGRAIDYTLVDVNRCGVPLIEIVSEPDIRSSDEAYAYLVALKQILQYTEVSTADMEKGKLRCDANVSIRPKGQKELGTKTELKNMNSFKAVQKALEVEMARQIKMVESGGKVVQETLLWDEDKQSVQAMRAKEFSDDYRYFPEPDLLPLEVSTEWLEVVRKGMPELPEARRKRFIEAYQLSDYDASLLTSDRPVADYFEAVVKSFPNSKTVANWITGEVFRFLKEKKISLGEFKVTSVELAALLKKLDSGSLSSNMAKEVLGEMVETGKPVEAVVKEKGLVQESDEAVLDGWVREVIAAFPKQTVSYKDGKKQLLGFFVGETVKKSGGKANPKLVATLVKKHLGE
ncbi:MAG: Asp-tRNA(Asn)/Glu-tRNA(Gln) amidotransferase subunit GatB [candidate division Zixibacteria bacterium]|nr:Asp-tRNA(Asn)/Glu-tRNA(Gln) amidotransferase subunit GatB [candidate division Zixibacteria bacterium]